MSDMQKVRIGQFIQTFTGGRFYPFDPQADEVFITDIAHALSLQCRFGGHCNRFYSVAEHSVRVSDYLLEISTTDNAKIGLLHDASEAYLIDLPRPLKENREFGEIYRNAEHKIEAVIAEKFKIVHPWPELVKRADNTVLATEKRDLMAYGGLHCTDLAPLPPPLPEIILPMPPHEAERIFIQRFASMFL